jgi:hypothetical protein
MNVLDLRNDLLDVYQKMRDGSIDIENAREAANVCGKILSTAKLQLQYNEVMKYTDRKINFLDVKEK